jgi:hypothetical protein
MVWRGFGLGQLAVMLVSVVGKPGYEARVALAASSMP